MIAGVVVWHVIMVVTLHAKIASTLVRSMISLHCLVVQHALCIRVGEFERGR